MLGPTSSSALASALFLNLFLLLALYQVGIEAPLCPVVPVFTVTKLTHVAFGIAPVVDFLAHAIRLQQALEHMLCFPDDLLLLLYKENEESSSVFCFSC